MTGGPKEFDATDLDEHMWLALVSTLLKWSHWLPVVALQKVAPLRSTRRVRALGFPPGQSSVGVTFTLRQASAIAYRWGMPLVVISADIR